MSAFCIEGSCDSLGWSLTLGVGLQEAARSHRKEFPATCWAGNQNPASIGPLHLACCSCSPCPPKPTFPSQGLVASAAPGQDCIILGFVCRAAGGEVGPPRPTPMAPLPSHLLLSPGYSSSFLSSQAPGTGGLSALPGDSQLPFHSCSPRSPRGC